MNISSTDLEFCLSQANLIAHHFGLNEPDSSNTIRDIGGLLRTCEHAFGARVEVYTVTVLDNDPWVQGACILSEDKRVEIVLIHKLNECWQRFILCKELFHIALNRAEYRNISIAGHIEEITLAFPDDDSSPRKPVVAEFLAEVGAMELLFPYKSRLQVLSANPQPNFAELASHFMIPKIHAEKYLSASYMANLGRFSLV
jgi:Zn-dependent peptidase ImmA (M78 family)